ncbi:MAG: hypothetical protein ACJATI_005224 [Halioglobus sp.]|jgi:hypothetical protein
MKKLHIALFSNMFYTIFVPTTKSFRETKEFFNFEIRFENYIRVHQKRIIVMRGLPKTDLLCCSGRVL